MKKIILLLIVISSLNFIQAQGFKIGAKAGANITGLNGVQFDEGFNFGYHAGGFAEIMFSKKVGIQPEVLWSQTSLTPASSFDALRPDLANLATIKLSYINIPILLTLKPVKLISFQVGPQFGILRDKSQSFTGNAASAFKSGDLSLLGGIQLNLLKIRLYGRYAIGLTDINDIQNVASAEKWKSKTLQLGLGLTL
ncbi:MAG: porin family protein [Chitinophagia bacterium]|jgi:hypothetical protein